MAPKSSIALMAWPLLSLTLCLVRAAEPIIQPRVTPMVSSGNVSLDAQTLDFRSEDVQRSGLGATDFSFSFASAADETKYGSVKGDGINNHPALATLPVGVAQTLVTLEACAINQPHSHPRGTEFSYVTEGELLFGFLEENPNKKLMSGGRFISSNVTKGNTIIIPQGLIHFAMNAGCMQAQFLASFPTADQGTQTTMRSLFADNVPTAVLRATTGLSNDEIKKIRKSVAANPNPSADPECLKRCARRRL